VRVDTESVLELSHPVNVGDDADVSEIRIASIFRIEVCRLKTEAICTSEKVSICPQPQCTKTPKQNFHQ
jgi:hypothetical protein